MKTLRIIFMFMFLVVLKSTAQENDFGIWTSINVEKEINKKLKATLTEEFRFKENATQLGTWFTNISAEYKFNKSFTASVNYRFIEKRAINLYYNPRQRFYVDGTYKYKHKKFSAALRTRFQYQVAYISNDAHLRNTQWYWRNKLTFKYEVKQMKPYVSGEVFYSLNKPTGNVVDELRFSIGSSYDINKKNSIDLYYMIDKEIQVANPLTAFIVGVDYTFSF